MDCTSNALLNACVPIMCIKFIERTLRVRRLKRLLLSFFFPPKTDDVELISYLFERIKQQRWGVGNV